MAEAADGATPNWLLRDHLSTTRGLTDGVSGASLLHYSPFGDESPDGAGSLTTETNHLFTGQWRDPATALQWHRARWLDVGVGRWLSEDPVFDWPGILGSGYGYGIVGATVGYDIAGLEFSLIGTLAGATVLLTIAAIAIPFAGAVMLAVKGKISLAGFLRETADLFNWLAVIGELMLGSVGGAGVGVAAERAARVFVKKLGYAAVKKVFSFVGFVSSVIALWASIKDTLNLLSATLPSNEAERFVARLMMGIILTSIIGKATKSGRYKRWFERGSDNDPEFWENLTPQQRSDYETAQGAYTSQT